MDGLDLLIQPGTLKSLLQHHSWKASILRCSALFIVQLSHPYMTTGKTIALTRQTFVGKIMNLLFNILFRLIIAFLPRSNCLLISWLQSSFAVILEPAKIKSVTVSTVSPPICHEGTGPDPMNFIFWMFSFKPVFSLSSFTVLKRTKKAYWTRVPLLWPHLILMISLKFLSSNVITLGVRTLIYGFWRI